MAKKATKSLAKSSAKPSIKPSTNRRRSAAERLAKVPERPLRLGELPDWAQKQIEEMRQRYRSGKLPGRNVRDLYEHFLLDDLLPEVIAETGKQYHIPYNTFSGFMRGNMPQYD